LQNNMTTENKSVIAEWYTGKSIFITGGSGFMGKVLVEKLLYSCNGIKHIYILMRSKRGKNPVTRIEEMWTLPVTTLKLEANLKDAVEQNVAGTVRIIDLAKKINNLLVFVHFSTAFCSSDIEVFEEKVYDCRDNPRDVIEVAKWMKLDPLEVATPSIIAPHPNTYTYSKRLAEKVVADEVDNMPVCIIRPSIVCPAALEPLPGWVDSLNGPMGLLVGAGKGVIRSMHAKAENKAQVVPVDIAINAAIVIAQRVGSGTIKSKEVPVYNLTQDEVVPITMGEVLNKGRAIVYDNPFEGQIWYPDGDLRSSKLVHNIYCILLHWLPAYFIDLLLFIFRYKTL
ncbi:fatty acyl-CoA reductase, partial [Asbolus verrucosus]